MQHFGGGGHIEAPFRLVEDHISRRSPCIKIRTACQGEQQFRVLPIKGIDQKMVEVFPGGLVGRHGIALESLDVLPDIEQRQARVECQGEWIGIACGEGG